MGSRARTIIAASSVAALTAGILGVVLTLRSPGSAARPGTSVPLGVRDEGAHVLTADPSRQSSDEPVVPNAPPVWHDDLTHLLLSTAGSPTVERPEGSSPADTDALLAQVRAVAGVADVRVVAPGTLTVATSGTAADFAAVPGLTGTVADLPFGVQGDALESTQWQLVNTGAPIATYPGHGARAGADLAVTAAWKVTRGAGVLVAVIDTGVDGAHPDLAARMWTNPKENCTNTIDDDGNGLVNDCNGWDFGSNDNTPSPDASAPSNDHGTHVAGLIAASRNDVGVVGAAPEATILPIKVTDSRGSSGTGQMAAGIRYAADMGAKIINISMGTGFGPTRAQLTPLESSIAYARSKGVLIVAAAGNDGRDMTAADSWPASYARYYDNTVAVGATWNDDTRASFSNFGLPAGTMVYAPGVAVPSTLPGSKWGPMSGTSMASPLAAGSAALVIGAGKASAPADVRALMVRTADNVGYGARLNDSTALGVPVVPSGPSGPSGPTTTTATTLKATTTTTTRRPATTTTVKPTTTTAKATTTTTRAPAITTTTKAPTTPTTTKAPTTATTTPRPAPQTVGSWSVQSMTVRAAPLTGGRPLTITGRFPTNATVFVWFGTAGPIVPAQVVASGTQLTLLSPVVAEAQVTDVVVKFSDAGKPVVLTLTRAFSFAPGA